MRAVRLALQDLGPTFIELGQIASTRADLLPPDYQAELARLQDQAQSEPWSTVAPEPSSSPRTARSA